MPPQFPEHATSRYVFDACMLDINLNFKKQIIVKRPFVIGKNASINVEN